MTEGIDGAQVANLSLEIAAGWSNVDGEWFWAGNDSYPESDLFGKYTDGTGVEPRHLDSRVALIQNFLPVLAASNSRGPDGLGDGPGSATYYTGPGGYTNTTKNWRNGDVGGYDTLPPSAVAKNSLVVGSTYSIDNGYASAAGVTIAPFSAFGPTDDGRIKPDIVAAGILNTASPRNTVGDEGAVETDFDSLDPSSGDLYDLFTGTSLSAAVVTGGLTLALEKRAEDRPDWSDFPLKASTLRALAVHTADEAGANPGPDYKFGYGLFNGRTLTQLVAADDAVDTKPNVKEVYISSLASESRFKVKAVSASKPLKVTIAWNDPAGTAAAAGVDPTQKKLTRDINLKVLDASGTTTTYPWVLNPDLTTKSATTRGAAATRGVDSVNNLEQVQIDSPVAGAEYTVVINPAASPPLIDGVWVSVIISNDSVENVPFAIISSSRYDSETWRLEWTTIPGGLYRVQGSSDLVNWVDATGDISALGTSTSSYVSGSGPGPYFWRVARYY